MKRKTGMVIFQLSMRQQVDGVFKPAGAKVEVLRAFGKRWEKEGKGKILGDVFEEIPDPPAEAAPAKRELSAEQRLAGQAALDTNNTNEMTAFLGELGIDVPSDAKAEMIKKALAQLLSEG